MRRVLLIAYHFPPLTGPGVFRPLRLVKYLPRHGWEATVISVHPRVRLPKDPALDGDLPPSLRVERPRTVEPRPLQLVLGRLGLAGLADAIGRWAMLPDDQLGWVPFALARARRALRQRPHHALLSTSAPFSAHLVGRRLRAASGLGWAADFRDEWTTNPYLRSRYPTRAHLCWNERLERAVLREADAVVSVSREWTDGLHARVPDEPLDKFHVVCNGWDAGHFAGDAPPPPGRFLVVYTGTFYGHRRPRVVLEAIERLLDAGRVPAADLDVRLVGHGGESIRPAGRLAGVVRSSGQRPYFETLELQRGAAVLLLSIPREDGPGKHTGKLYNYLASGRPILALAPEASAGARLVRASRSGLVVPPDDPQAVAEALERLYRQWRDGTAATGPQDRSMVERYEAGPQTQRWAAILDRLAGGGR